MSSLQWCFDHFRLDRDNACLWDTEQELALPPKAFDVLWYLVTHPDRLVTKDELLDAVWPETAVSDVVVRIAISAVRKVLGDTARTPRFIATVPRRGYRFLAPVAEYPQAAPAPTALMSLVTPPPQTPPEVPSAPHQASLHTALLPDAERRLLTVLCCDLMNAPSLAGRLDPEDFREVLRAYHQTCAAVIGRFDGHIAQYLNDGLLVYFGYPVAHEDDARRAVWTGLGILDALTPLNARLALPPDDQLTVRLGVHTGLVVVGDVGEGTRREPLALGETPHIAARLPHLAAPTTLVISAATYPLIAGYFTCEELGEQSLRGLAHPLRVYRVLRPSEGQSRLAVAAVRGLTSLVGREAEVGLLVERWARVKAGMGQVVVLMGEAGIGKSRLVQVLKDHVAGEASTCVECRGSPYDQHTAWYPIADLVQRWLQWQPGEAPDATIGHLETILAPYHVALDEAVPLVAALVALPLPAARYRAQSLSPEQQRHNTFALVLALVEVLAERHPVLVIVEDLHWVDASTLELLGLLLNQVPSTRLYLVLTCRPEFQLPWGFRTYLTPLILNRLTATQAEAMVGRMLGGQHLPAAVLAQIVAQTDGIPLFVEEVTKAVLEAGRSPDVQAQDARRGQGSIVAIPATLHEALLARLDRLGSAKGVAQLGATLGRQFSYVLLRAVAPMEDASLQRDLAVLVAAELLYQRGLPPHAVYTFKHVLVQEAAYELVLQRVRRQTHQRIFQVLEVQFPEMRVSQPGLLAHHALRGEVWDKAVAYCDQAGATAMVHSAYHEAVSSFEQGLEALSKLPAGLDTLAQAIDLRLALRHALYPLGEFERLLVCLQDAQALAEALGDHHRLGWVSASLLAHYAVVCDPDGALTAGQRALALATTLGDVGLTVTAQYYLGIVSYSLGGYRQAVDYAQKNLACLHGALLQEHFGLPGRAAVLSRGLLVYALAECGAFAAARAPAEEGVRMAEAADHPYSRFLAYWAMSVRALFQGDLRQAIPALERTFTFAQGAHIRLGVHVATAALGAAYALAGRTADALLRLEQAVEQALAMRFFFDHALRVVWLGEAYLLAGRLDEAYSQAQRALEFSRAHQERGHEAYALRLLGEVAAQRTPPQVVQAKAHYQQALALAEELDMCPLQAHCHRGLGMQYATIGQREQARAELSTAIELYRSMDMTFWLPATEAALAQVEGR